MAAGEFREDLYYRLNVVPVLLPPLRERKEDIPLLAEHFLEKVSQREGYSCQGFQREAIKAFQEYNWPGNVRELENVVERMVTLTEGVQLGLEDLPLYFAPGDGRGTGFAGFAPGKVAVAPGRSMKKILSL